MTEQARGDLATEWQRSSPDIVVYRPKGGELNDTHDIPVGPKATAEIATYTSMTQWHGRRVLWYPDRTYTLLGKYICRRVRNV